jgi:hypothetical protein
MNRYALAALVPTTLVVLAVVGAQSHRGPSAQERSEIERIQVHLAGAERVLEGRDLASLTPDQKRARAVQVSRLEEYRDRGVFPHNHDFRGARRPYFVDDHGVLCAMAHLISESGRDDIVRLVQRMRNNATVLELAADPVIGPALAAWLDDAGLTVAEAQRIQPEYGFNDLVLGKDEIPAEYLAASAVVGGLNLTTTYLNVKSSGAELSPGWTRYVGVLGGLAGIGLGGTLLVEDEYEDATTLGVSNLLVGAVATVASLSSIARAKKASGTASIHSDPRHVSFAPAFHGGMAPGVGVRLRF